MCGSSAGAIAAGSRGLARKSVHPAAGSAPSIVAAPVLVAHTRLGAVGYRTVGSGPALILVTGLGASMEDWEPALVDGLAKHHRVVIFDNAGIGRTRALAGPLSIDAMVGQTSALIATLRLHRPDVLGWSMGGMIAQGLAVQHPSQVRRLLLCATQAGTGRAIPPPTAAARAVASGNPAEVLATIFPPDQTKSVRAYVAGILGYPQRTVVSHATIVAQGRAITAWLEGRQPPGRRIGSITAPTLVADGDVDRLDPLANDRQLARAIPHAKLVTYRDAGHAFLFQAAKAFAHRVQSFLR